VGDRISFKFNGQIGANYQIQVSADLAVWFPLTSVRCTEAMTYFSDAVDSDRLFYRVMAE
jgi:hypothetical protein